MLQPTSEGWATQPNSLEHCTTTVVSWPLPDARPQAQGLQVGRDADKALHPLRTLGPRLPEPRLGPRSWSVYPTLSPCIPNRLGPTVCDHLMKHTIDLSLSALLRQHTDSRVNYHPESTHPSWRHPRAAKALPCIRNRVPHPQRLSLREVQDYLPCHHSQSPVMEPQAKALEARQPVLHEWVDSWGSSTFPSS